MQMLMDMAEHKWYANARFLAAMREHPEASTDQQLRDLLHHILLANRFWFCLSRDVPFSFETESKTPESLPELVVQFRNTHAEESVWLANIGEKDLQKQLHTPYIPGRSFTVEQGIVQICMHSHGHRAQGAVRLRQLGVTPPTLDFITWLKDRSPVEWT